MKYLIAAAGLAVIALSGCDQQTKGDETEIVPVERRLIQDRFKIYDSVLDHGGTVSQFLEAIDRRDLTVFALIDHQAGAISVDMELPPMTLVIFGSPRAGTPLIAAEPLMGAELPLRALIFDEDGQTKLALTGLSFLEREYGLEDERDMLKSMKTLLETLATEATTI